MVPAHRRRCLEKSLTLAADALVFDLEDSVPGDKKDEALVVLDDFLQQTGKIDKQLFVRVNPGTQWKEWDRVGKWLTGVMVPKVRRRDDLVLHDVPTFIVVETPMAVLRLEDFFGLQHVLGGVFGVGDYAAGMGVVDREWVGSVNSRFAYAKQRLATVARAFDKQALDTSFFVKGADAVYNTRKQWDETASWGFTGASPIHPSHVPVANDAFAASHKEVRWAVEVVNGTRKNNGEVWVDGGGYVVGPPHMKQVERRLQWPLQAQ